MTIEDLQARFATFQAEIAGALFTLDPHASLPPAPPDMWTPARLAARLEEMIRDAESTALVTPDEAAFARHQADVAVGQMREELRRRMGAS